MASQKYLSVLGQSLALSLPVVIAESKSNKMVPDSNSLPRKIKPSHLPMYGEPQDIFRYEYYGKEKTKLEEGFSVVRKELQSSYEATADSRGSVRTLYETGKAHSMASVDFVLDEENVAAKVGVITAGGLLGLLLGGRRKGFIKKLLYTTVGAAGGAGAVYPKEANKIIQEVYDNAGEYSLIAYNFITGVKPQGENKLTTSETIQKAGHSSSLPASREVSTVSPIFESLLQQSSDIFLWGFRLFDREDKESSITVAKSSGKDVVLSVTPMPPKSSVQGDFGQGNPDDKDMYTTRT